MAATSDGECVRAVLAGDSSAYGELYDRYARLVRASCFDHTGNLADAQDLAQEAFLRAYGRLGSLRDAERFGPWLMGVTRLVCLEWRRRRGRTRSLEIFSQPPAATEPAGADERLDRLDEALRSLPERERLAVHIFYLQDQPTDRARRLMGLSRSGFYRVLQRARNRLRKRLGDSGEDGP